MGCDTRDLKRRQHLAILKPSSTACAAQCCHRRHIRTSMLPVRSRNARLILLVLVAGAQFCSCGLNCWGSPFAAPGFVSDRRLFPKGDPVWDGQQKVAFRNADCTYLVGNFRDTGSDAVVILFPAATIHKEWWPNPQIQHHLAVKHNVSSLAVDVAGRGESCGTEVGPGCESTVRHALAKQPLCSLPATIAPSARATYLCRSRTWLLQQDSSTACLADSV